MEALLIAFLCIRVTITERKVWASIQRRKGSNITNFLENLQVTVLNYTILNFIRQFLNKH